MIQGPNNTGYNAIIPQENIPRSIVHAIPRWIGNAPNAHHGAHRVNTRGADSSTAIVAQPPSTNGHGWAYQNTGSIRPAIGSARIVYSSGGVRQNQSRLSSTLATPAPRYTSINVHRSRSLAH